jgi:Disaggregatase related
MRTSSMLCRLMIVCLPLVISLSSAHDRVIYVDDDAPPPGDGTSWATAYRYFQDALADANDPNDPVEIRVAQGTYKPDQGTGYVLGDTNATFQINRSLILLGGFAGPQTEDPNRRDVKACRTVFTGDLEGNDRRDLPEPLVASAEWRASIADNSLHVLTIQDVQSTVVLDGVSITAGACSYCPYERCRCAGQLRGSGGGIYSIGSTLLVRDCTFTFNSAACEGGALYSEESDCRVEDSTFYRNYASNGLAGQGGALACSGGRMVLANDCLIANFATGLGGAIHGLNCDLLDVSNCLFACNVAYSAGTAISALGSDLNLTLCTVASDGPGAALFLGPDEREGRAEIANSIFSNGAYGIYNNPGIPIRISYSALCPDRVWDPCDNVSWGEGNINQEPLFAGPGYWDPDGPPKESNPAVWVDGDYHLKSQAGRWDPNSGSWVVDDVTSPCIDAGDPNSDFSGEVWPHGGRINMGAYGATPEASMSAEPTEMFLPRIACIYWYNSQLAESCQSLLQAHGCSATLIRSDDLLEHALDGYDLIMIATDTSHPNVWADEQAVAALVESGKPVLGLGEGGYRFFGELGLAIGYPNGASDTFDSIYALDPSSSLFDTPYHVAIPEDRVVPLYSGTTDSVMIYLWPAPPENVTPFGRKANDQGYYPLVAEQGHLLWGFTGSPDQMTETGKHLFLNAVILTATARLERETVQSL